MFKILKISLFMIAILADPKKLLAQHPASNLRIMADTVPRYDSICGLGDFIQCTTGFIEEKGSFVSEEKSMSKSLSKDHISKFLVGSSAVLEHPEKNEMVDLIWNMRNLLPNTNNYFDLAHNQNEGFRVFLLNENECLQFLKNGVSGRYLAEPKIIMLPVTSSLIASNGGIYKLMEAVRHEYRHSAMHTIQQALSNRSTDSAECYYPINEENKANVEAWLKIGDKKVNSLWQDLQLESKNKLRKTKQIKLDNLRNKWQGEYEKYYKIIVIMQLDEMYAENSVINMVVNWDNLVGVKAGNMTIIDIFPSKNNKKYIFIGTINDVLYGIVHAHDISITLANKDNAQKYLRERDAHMHGSLPQSIIQHYYPQLYHYTNGLIKEASLKPQAPQPTRNEYFDSTKLEVNGCLFSNKNPELSFPGGEVKFIYCTHVFVKNNKLSNACETLSSLVKHGIFSAEEKKHLKSVQNECSKGNKQAVVNLLSLFGGGGGSSNNPQKEKSQRKTEPGLAKNRAT